jgi:hypothetical protein
MKVQIKNFKNEVKEVEITESMTLDELKVKIQEVFKVPSTTQKILFAGKQLTDSTKTLKELGIGDNAMLALMIIRVLLAFICSPSRSLPRVRVLSQGRHRIQLLCPR